MPDVPIFVKKLLTGLTIPQEYICLAEDLVHPLHVFLTVKGQSALADVTEAHLMLGYKPLIIAIVAEAGKSPHKWLTQYDHICLTFQESVPILNFTWRGFPSDQSSLARLELKKIFDETLDSKQIFFFESVHGHHSFISPPHQWVAGFRERWRKRKTGNVDLPGNLYDQVRIAYSIPRSVQVITLSDGENMNMFPTDLHGSAGEGFYFCSLRHGGLATQQLEWIKKIVLSEVSAMSFADVYSLGNNHMQELKNEANFPVHHFRSASFQFPLPKSVVRYRELRHLMFKAVGIHRIHFFEVVNDVTLDDKKEGVRHIHQFYAQWRKSHGIGTSMLIRQ